MATPRGLLGRARARRPGGNAAGSQAPPESPWSGSRPQGRALGVTVMGRRAAASGSPTLHAQVAVMRGVHTGSRQTLSLGPHHRHETAQWDRVPRATTDVDLEAKGVSGCSEWAAGAPHLPTGHRPPGDVLAHCHSGDKRFHQPGRGNCGQPRLTPPAGLLSLLWRLTPTVFSLHRNRHNTEPGLSRVDPPRASGQLGLEPHGLDFRLQQQGWAPQRLGPHAAHGTERHKDVLQLRAQPSPRGPWPTAQHLPGRRKWLPNPQQAAGRPWLPPAQHRMTTGSSQQTDKTNASPRCHPRGARRVPSSLSTSHTHSLAPPGGPRSLSCRLGWVWGGR